MRRVKVQRLDFERSRRQIGAGGQKALLPLSRKSPGLCRDTANMLKFLILLNALLGWGITSGDRQADQPTARELHSKMCIKRDPSRLHCRRLLRRARGDGLVEAAPALVLRGGSDNPEYKTAEESEGHGTSEMQGTSSLQNVEEITMEELKALPLPSEQKLAGSKTPKMPEKSTAEKKGDQSATESKENMPMEYTETSVEKGVGSTGSGIEESKTGSEVTAASAARAVRKYRHPTHNAARDMIREKMCEALAPHVQPGDKYSALDAAIAIEHSMYP
eukprot:767000-Hanusia_phi.AAC.3